MENLVLTIPSNLLASPLLISIKDRDKGRNNNRDSSKDKDRDEDRQKSHNVF